MCVCVFVNMQTASAYAGMNVTLFTFTTGQFNGLQSAMIDLGSSISFRCQITYNTSRPPNAQLYRDFNGVKQHVATNDQIEDQFSLDGRYSSKIINNDPNGMDAYEWTISSEYCVSYTPGRSARAKDATSAIQR